MTSTFLRLVLFATGIMIVVLGCDSAFGGVATLGLQTSPDYFTVTDQQSFMIRDSHVRFLGGAWIGLGLLYIVGAWQPLRWRDPILVTIGFIFLGGLARLTGPDVGIVFGQNIVGSFLAELLLFPLLGLWLYRATPTSNQTAD